MTPKQVISEKSEHSKVSENIAFEAVAQKDILDQSKNVAVKILMLRYSLVFILVGLATGLGGGSFVILRYKELSTFRAEFSSAAMQTERSMVDHLLKSYVAAEIISAVYTGQQNATEGTFFPFYTMPEFDPIVTGINQLSKSRITSLSPLVKNTTRLKWEQYAKDNVASLHGPASLEISTNGSWIVADGIFTTDSRGKPFRSPESVSESLYPNLMFPVWQVAPLQMNAVAVMFDPHAKQGTRMQAIDRVLSTMQGASTDIVQLVIDSGKYRPSTILYFPVATASNSRETIGLIGMAFTWDEIFAHTLPSYLNRVDCVVTTISTSFTLSLDNGVVTIIGTGDLHNSDFDHYAAVISDGLKDSSTSLQGYRVTLYPTNDLYYTYITTYPQNVCIGAVTIVVFTALIFTLYVYLVTIRQAQLEEVATRSLVMNTSRDAVLQSKKIYVRYISHEMRTPLNVAFLGLKILIKDLSEDPTNLDRVETVNDISKACSMALSILNDLLNYDKLEDGALLIEPKRVAALPFILKSAEALNLQVKEKGLILTFDLDDAHSCTAPNFGINSESYETKLYGLSNESSWGVRSCCLSSADVINVDTHKMNQVIGNLVSNAIKFTPAGRSIIVRARKVVPDQQYGSSTRSTSVVGKANHDDSLDRASSFIRSFYYQIFCCASELETDFQSDVRAGRYTDSHRLRESPAQSASSSSGYLVLEVIDSGVGMASEDSKRLFKEIVQFNPSKLQAGGGSGLGMMITKGIVDMHGGEISVYSAGEGQGSTFTLKIPLVTSPPQSRKGSLAEMDRRSNPNSADSSSHRSSQFFIDMASSHTLEDLPGPAVREVCDKTKDENENKDHAVIPIGVEDHFRLQERGSAEDPERCNESSCFMREISIPGSASHTLPIPIPDPLPDFIPVLCGEPCQPAGAALTPTISNADPRQRKFNILVVDDSKLNRKMLVKSLKTESHSCDEAEDGLEAVRMVTRRSESRTSEGIHVNSYDAILMDFMMPIMDGPTATEILRDMGYTGVIIGVTGNALPSDVEYFTVKGADKVLLKPVDVDVLLLTVHSLLSQC